MTLGGPLSGGGAEVVLIEFLGDAKSAVASAEETVGALDQVTAAAERAGEAQAQAGAAATTGAKKSKVAAAESAGASRKQATATEEATAATDASTAATKRSVRASKEAQGAALGTTAAWKKNSTAMVGVGKGLTKYVSLPLIGLGAVATKMSLDFSKAMLLIETHTDTSRKQVDLYRKSILAMSQSGNYTQGPKELAEAMYHVASDGYKGAKAMEVLRESSHLATVGQSNLVETTYALVSAEKTGIKGTENMHAAIGSLNAIVGAGDMKMQDLVGALSTGILPSAKAVGLSLRDVGASLDILTQRGQPAQQAAYRLRMNFAMLSPYTEKAQKQFEALGLGQYQLVSQLKKPQGLLHALDTLKEHLKGLSKYEQNIAIQNIFGGGRSSTGMLILLQNLDSLKRSYGEINHLAGETNKNLKTALASPANVWAKQWAKLQGILVELGDKLVPEVIPALKSIAGAVGDIVGTFNSLPKVTQDWIVKLGVAAIAFGPILAALGKVGALVTTISETSLFGGAAGAAGAAGAGAAGVEAGAGVGAGVTAGEGGLASVGFTAADLIPPVGAAAAIAALTLATMNSGDAFDTAHEKYKKAAKGLNDETIPAWRRAAKAMKAVHDEVGHLEGSRNARATEKVEREMKAPGSILPNRSGQKGQVAADRAEVRKILRLAQEEFATTIGRIRLDQLGGLHKLLGDLHSALGSAANAWKTGTQPWRAHVVEAMQATVHSIETGMQSGSIKAGVGRKAINKILGEIHLAKGTDPLGLAKSIVSSFKQGHAVTQSGIDTLLTDFKLMPKGAREQAQDAVLEMANAWAKGHPKIEHQVDVLRHNLEAKLGQTKTVARREWHEMTKGMSTDFSNLDTGVHTSVEDIEAVVGRALSNLQIGKSINFGIKHGDFSAAGIGPKKHEKAQGGFLLGSGRRDTEHVMAAPGEAFLTHQQQGPVSIGLAASKAMGLQPYGSLPELFSEVTTPHYMARGGLVEPKIGGRGTLHNLGQGAVHKVYMAGKHDLDTLLPETGGTGYMPGGGGPVVAQIGRILMAHGLNKFGAAGIIGNALQESGWNPASVGSGGGGLWGFTTSPNSLADLQAFAKRSKKPWTDVGLQTQFLLNHVSHGLIAELNAASNGAEAAKIFMERWERPAVATENLANRQAGARKAVAMGFAKGGFVKWGKGAPKPTEHPLILVGPHAKEVEEQGSSGSSGSKKKKAKTISPTDAVQWAMRRMGSSDRWGYPGEWCGAFLGADMEAIGLTPPSGFPSAAAWASYGSALGQNHIQAGAILDYGSAHVAMAISANEQIQGNNHAGVVGTSGIGGVIGGSPLTAVRWPPYTAGPGAGSGTATAEKVPKQVTGSYGPKKGSTGKGGGTNAPQKRYKVTTQALSFGGLPTTLAGVNKELRLRRRQLGEYRGAVADAKGDPKTKAALLENEKAIRRRIAELVKLKAKLAAAAMREREGKKIQKRGLFPAIEAAIEASEHGYAQTSKFAEQIAALEPSEEGPAALYRTEKENPAWLAVLGSEATWRNSLLGGEEAAAARLRSLEGDVERIEALKKTNPKRYKQEKYKIPSLKAAIAAVRNVYVPPSAKSFKALSQGRYTSASGEWASALENLQGPEGFAGDHLRMAALPTTPVPGSFGGMIWDTQMALRELGITSGAGVAGGESDTAQIEALKQQVESAEKRAALLSLQYGPFSEFLKKMPPYIGAFAKGGEIPGSPAQAYTATVHGGETIVPAGGGGDVHVHLHGDLAAALQVHTPGLAREVERSMGEKYRHLVFSPGGGR